MKQRRIINLTGAFSASIMLATVILAWPQVAGAAKLVGHKALYTVEPGVFKSGGDFVGATGHMEIRLENACDGWTMSQTLQMNLQLANGNELRQFHRYTGQESQDGIRYDFFSSSRIGERREDFRGRATMESASSSLGVGPGNAVFRIPEGRKLPLPEGTRFPIGHTAYLIDRAQAGDHLVAAIVFDGGDDTGPQEVTAFIARKQSTAEVIGKEIAKSLGPLVATSGWKIRMAFYKLDSQGGVPDYEIEALQLENGVAPWLLLDYQDFSVVLKMNKLEELPSPKC